MSTVLPDWCADPKPDAPKVCLQLTTGDGTQVLELPQKKCITIGKDADNDVVLTASCCSRKHAMLLRDVRGRSFLMDLNSTHKTLMHANKKELAPMQPYAWDIGIKFRFADQAPPHCVIAALHLSGKLPVAKGTKRPLEPEAQGVKPEPEERGANSDTAKSVEQRVPGESMAEPPQGPTPARSMAPNPNRAKPEVELPRTQSADDGGQAPAAKRRLTLSAGAAPHEGHKQPIGPELPPDFHKQQAAKVPLPSPQPPAATTRRQSVAGPQAPSLKSGAATPSSSSTGSSGKGLVKCDKCDGPHITDACPHFRKSREDHKDAWCNYGKKHPLSMGRSGGRLLIRNGQPVRQPGDGSCLFHSLCYGLKGLQMGGSAQSLRQEIATFIGRNPQLEISGDTLEEWVRWDAHTSVQQYARRMAVSGWGGGIEMAACSLLKKVNVHVYEPRRGGEFERISCFDSPEPTKRTINVLYQGGMHYDALFIRSR